MDTYCTYHLIWNFKGHTCFICSVSRCDFPAYSSFNLPNFGRHPGFLHGPGTYAWNGGARVHCGKSSWTSGLFVRVTVCICVLLPLCVCVCVLCLALGRCWWTAAAGSSSLHCALSFSLSKHTDTHKQSNKHFMDAVPFFFCKTTFSVLNCFDFLVCFSS